MLIIISIPLYEIEEVKGIYISMLLLNILFGMNGWVYWGVLGRKLIYITWKKTTICMSIGQRKHFNKFFELISFSKRTVAQ